MQAYYTGKLDAGDPDGTWIASAKAAQQSVIPAEFQEAFTACREPLTESLQRQLESIRG
jgi:hypothetical protein